MKRHSPYGEIALGVECALPSSPPRPRAAGGVASIAIAVLRALGFTRRVGMQPLPRTRQRR